MDIVEEVKNWVESECKKPTSKYGYEPFIFHFGPVVKYANELAEELGADKEIVTVAGWLHDIGSIIDGRENHHITGAKIAEQKLKEFNYPAEKIELVKKCILNHRGSLNNNRESIEEIVVAEADVLSNFDNIGGLFKAAYEYEGLTQGEAHASVLKKLENKYNQLHLDKSKELIGPRFEAAKLLLSDKQWNNPCYSTNSFTNKFQLFSAQFTKLYIWERPSKVAGAFLLISSLGTEEELLEGIDQ